MFICSKWRQNLSEIQDRTLERIQKVIWDHLLAFKGEIIQKQALFSLPFWTPNNLNTRCFDIYMYAVCSVFSFILFSTSQRTFFRLNHLRKARKRYSYSMFSSQAISLDVLDQNVALCYVHVFWCPRATTLPVFTPAIELFCSIFLKF